MKKIIIFGEFLSDNLGDVILGESQKYTYSKLGINIELSNFELCNNIKKNDKENISFDNNNKRGKANFINVTHRNLYRKSNYYRHMIDMFIFFYKYPKYRLKLVKYLKNSQHVIIGGGQLFSDNSLRMLLSIFVISRVARKNEIRVSIIGSGLCYPKTIISKNIIKYILSKHDNSNVYLRDSKSISVANDLSNLNLNENNIIPDFAISYLTNKSILSNNEKPVNRVGIAPISFKCIPKEQQLNIYNYDNWWIELASLLSFNGYTPVLFCHGTQEDFDRCFDIYNKAKLQGIDIELMPRPSKVDNYIEYMAEFKTVICQRLHVSITAYAMNKSPISLPWDDKVKCFYNEALIPQRYLDYKSIQHKDIIRLVKCSKLNENRKKELINKVNNVIQNAIKD